MLLQVPKKMKPPIYVYYQLDQFYQNHRRLLKSFVFCILIYIVFCKMWVTEQMLCITLKLQNQIQLHFIIYMEIVAFYSWFCELNKKVNNSLYLESCFWCSYVKSRSDEQYTDPSAADKTSSCEPEAEISGDRPIVPCGLIAWSLFNDTYTLSINDIALPINKNNIAWESDKTHKFGSNVYPRNFQNRTFIGGGKLDESIPVSQFLLHLIFFYMTWLQTYNLLCVPFNFSSLILLYI